MKILLWLFFFGIIFTTGCFGQSGRKKPQNTEPEIKAVSGNVQKPTYNIFLENSGSMNGYVNSQAEFKETVGNFLTDIEINGLADSIKLNYINSKVIPIHLDIPNFINNLNPTSFSSEGGHITTTNVSLMLKAILDRLNDNTVGIFISDCVFSPDKKINAQQYLVNQQLEIKRNFAAKLDNYKLTIIVLQLSSEFEGAYFNCQNQTTPIKAKRPYYIWIIGNHRNLTALFEKVKKENFKGGGVQNFYSAYTTENVFDYGILISPKLGYYNRDKVNPKNKIIDAEKEDKGIHKGKFQFSIGVNFKGSFLDENYILDAKNYLIPANYSIEVVKNNISTLSYSHILKLSTNTLKTETVNIKLRNILPGWIAEKNSDDDTKINQANQLTKTFGLKYLVEGIFEAYKSKNNNKDTYFEINISVNQ